MEYNETNPAKLDLSILRVKKSLHNEASQTFLEENPWVCIEIEASLLKRLLREKIGQKEGLPWKWTVPVARYVHTAAVAVANMGCGLFLLWVRRAIGYFSSYPCLRFRGSAGSSQLTKKQARLTSLYFLA